MTEHAEFESTIAILEIHARQVEIEECRVAGVEEGSCKWILRLAGIPRERRARCGLLAHSGGQASIATVGAGFQIERWRYRGLGGERALAYSGVWINVVRSRLRLRLGLRRGVKTGRAWSLLLRLLLRRRRGTILGHRGQAIRYSVAVVAVAIKVASHTGHQCSVGSVVEILGLLANTVMAGVLEAALDTTLTGSFVT